MKLLSMIDFVLNKEQARTEDEYFKEGFYSDCNARILSQIFNYATFLNQHLNLGMFVPAIEVDGKWEVLEMPKNFEATMKGNYFTSSKSELFLLQQYQQAKDKVLFEGFELGNTTTQSYAVYNDDSRLIFSKDSNLCLDEKTINDLIKYAPTLTAKGQELSGLNK